MFNRRATAIASLLFTALALPAVASADSVKLGKPKLKRGSKYIVDFTLDKVAPSPLVVGVGGITAKDGFDIKGCQDSPTGAEADWKGRTVNGERDLTLTVTAVEDAGKSGRGWPGTRCGFRINDSRDPKLFAELPIANAPAFAAPTALVRADNLAIVNLNINGYAADHASTANLVVALDLTTHAEVWRSKPLTSNAAMLVLGDSLVTGYGFTKEKASVFVFDVHTGKQTQQIALPKAPEAIVRIEGALLVRIYDGYAKLPLTMVEAK